MAKRTKRSAKKVARKVAKKITYPILAKNHKIGSRHRISAYYGSKGALLVSRKSKIAKAGTKVNPFKIKGIVNTLKPAVITSTTAVGTMLGLNKVMPLIPYVKDVQNISFYPRDPAVQVVLVVIWSLILSRILFFKFCWT